MHETPWHRRLRAAIRRQAAAMQAVAARLAAGGKRLLQVAASIPARAQPAAAWLWAGLMLAWRWLPFILVAVLLVVAATWVGDEAGGALWYVVADLLPRLVADPPAKGVMGGDGPDWRQAIAGLLLFVVALVCSKHLSQKLRSTASFRRSGHTPRRVMITGLSSLKALAWHADTRPAPAGRQAPARRQELERMGFRDRAGTTVAEDMILACVEYLDYAELVAPPQRIEALAQTMWEELCALARRQGDMGQLDWLHRTDADKSFLNMRQALADRPDVPEHERTLCTLAGRYLSLRRLGGLSWQQNLRAIKEYADTGLSTVIVVPSRDSDPRDNPLGLAHGFAARDGSEHQFGLFKRFVEAALARRPGGARIAIECYKRGGVAYDDYDAVYTALEDAARHLQDYGCGGNGRQPRAGDIVFDVTPGLKPFSIAAAALTLTDKGYVFCYVTNDGRLNEYNAAVEAFDLRDV